MVSNTPYVQKTSQVVRSAMYVCVYTNKMFHIVKKQTINGNLIKTLSCLVNNKHLRNDK